MSSEIFTKNWINHSEAERRQFMNQYAGGQDLRILLLDDEPDVLKILSENMTELGFTPFGTTDPHAALEYIQRHRSFLALIVSDFKMPDMNGFVFREAVLGLAPEVPFAILSGFVDREMALKGMELKIAAFIDKPIDTQKLFELITKECSPRIQTIHEEQDLLRGFTDDALNLIEQIEELTLELEHNSNDTDAVTRIFGMVHTIKGSSGFFEPRTLHTFAHRFEDVLKGVQCGGVCLDGPMISVWLQACDILKSLIMEFKTGAHHPYDLEALTQIFRSAPLPDSSSNPLTPLTRLREGPQNEYPLQAQRPKGPQELKVAVSLLDEFMQISGEMTVIRNMITKFVRNIEKQHPTDKDVVRLSELLEELHKVNGSVQSKITEIRQVPVRSVVKPLIRIIRDTAQILEKDVELKVTGEEVRIDTSVAEVLSSSLVHIVRNSLDHGIEYPEDRITLGKSRRGEITIETKIIGDTIVVELKDDGRGINPDAIRKKLINNGAHSPEQASRLSLSDLYLMIFSPGFSTAQQITDISGRGVGMSMVKDVVEAIGGHITIDSHLGQGTRFTLTLPVPKSVLITHCLFVTSLNMTFGIPQDEIQRVIYVEEALARAIIDSVAGAPVLRVNDNLLPIISLSHLLSGDVQILPEKLTSGYLILLNASNQTFCLWVDSVLDVEDAVVKAITAGSINKIGLYLGSTFLGDGTIGLILNAEGIAARTRLFKPLQKEGLRKNQMSLSEDHQQHSPSRSEAILVELFQKVRCAIPREAIFRLEEFSATSVQDTGRSLITPYRNQILTFIDLAPLIDPSQNEAPKMEARGTLPTLVIQLKTGFIGIVIEKILDLVNIDSVPTKDSFHPSGCAEWLIIEERPVLLIDIENLLSLITDDRGREKLQLSA